ncbi:MAG TPA: hypothetical protein VIM98_05935 [Dyella sp.]|uniref:hypothetical protein n=1 Tax=Dyella sp. TaxID=1869338 RepID=UPI002F953406
MNRLTLCIVTAGVALALGGCQKHDSDQMQPGAGSTAATPPAASTAPTTPPPSAPATTPAPASTAGTPPASAGTAGH